LIALIVPLAPCPDFLSTGNSKELSRASRQAFEAYLAKMRFFTGQPSGNSR
jgi:hypothetical protein